MCGIAGIISKDTGRISRDNIIKMTDAIAHRGPDGTGCWINGTGEVGLGHRRLSIIDLSTEANQPMHYLDRYSIIFNGEIYNYPELKESLKGSPFSTQSDTEVILALYDKYKEDCLKYMDGMFALVIYDDQTKQIFAARDRFGEKPFFYSYVSGKHFIFASELKALWAGGVPREVNHKILFNFLAHDFITNPDDLSETFYNGCTRLVHGHYLKLSVNSLDDLQIKRYYDIDDSVQDHTISEDEAAEKFRELFTTSVKRRLRSDVPVGSSLSGGLDSSLVVCVIDQLINNSGQSQQTFSARFPGFAKDEGRFMEMVTGQTNSRPNYVYPDGEGLLKDFDQLCYHQEEPFKSASIYAQYCVMKTAKEKEVTVLLDGQGADEYLAGYHSYYNQYFNELRLTYPSKYRPEYEAYKQLQQGNAVNNVVKKDLEFFLRSRIPSLVNPAKDLLLKISQVHNPFFSSDYFSENSRHIYHLNHSFTSLNQKLKASLLGGEIQELLRYADRNSMAHSREVRLPFLFHELVEFVFSLPPHYKIHNGWTKWIMRHAYADLLPTEITWRKDKIGYEPPQAQWLKTAEVQQKITESTKKLYENGILSRKEYKKEAGGATNLKKVWPILIAGNLT